MRKVRIRAICGLPCANLGSELCAANPWIIQVLAHTLFVAIRQKWFLRVIPQVFHISPSVRWCTTKCSVLTQNQGEKAKTFLSRATLAKDVHFKFQVVSRLSTHAVQLHEDSGSCHLKLLLNLHVVRSQVSLLCCLWTAGGFSKKVVARFGEACTFSQNVCSSAIQAIQDCPFICALRTSLEAIRGLHRAIHGLSESVLCTQHLYVVIFLFLLGGVVESSARIIDVTFTLKLALW